jgi:hypothetical protein
VLWLLFKSEESQARLLRRAERIAGESITKRLFFASPV